MTNAQLPESMSALVVTAHGDTDVLAVHQVDVPRPQADQLLVEVAASGVNFIDVYQREGVYPTKPPFVLGGEFAGRVVAVGDDVHEFGIGDVVATATAASGSHAQYALVGEEFAVPVPEPVAGDLAAAAMLQGMTAHYLVRSTYELQSAQWALIHAAAGGVGQLLVQLTKNIGAHVVATVGSAEKAQIARDLGADEVIRYDEVTGDALSAAVRDASDGGVHVVYDGVGKSTFDASLASLRRRGMLVLYGGSSGQVPAFEPQRLNSGGSLFLTRAKLGDYAVDRDEVRWRAGEILGAIADGTLNIEIGGRYDLDQAAQAYRDLEGRRTTGKLLITP